MGSTNATTACVGMQRTNMPHLDHWALQLSCKAAMLLYTLPLAATGSLCVEHDIIALYILGLLELQEQSKSSLHGSIMTASALLLQCNTTAVDATTMAVRQSCRQHPQHKL